MTHLPILPILVPLFAAILALAVGSGRIAARRAISLAASVLGVGVAAALLVQSADGTIAVYALGDWSAPFGIVLVADRLAALMVAVTAVIALPALLVSAGGHDEAGPHFHVLFQLQLAGLNGAFLTGDLFNLFVFFEVLLIASYGLLAHGGGGARIRSGLHYVVLNLAGSTLFLIALGLLYGIFGTLNMADLAARLPALPASDLPLARTALVMAMVVFALKAALLPLSFWLPHAYAAAAPPVAALFAVMTKVGVYALLRLSAVGLADDLLDPWLLPLAFGTVALGTVGLFAATRLATAVAHLVLVSTGTLLVAVALGGTALTAAALFYMPHTVPVTAALFLLAGHVAEGRGAVADRLRRGPPMRHARWLAGGFLLLSIAVAGLPPLSGFLGKLMMLSAAPAAPGGYGLWAALILSGFAGALVLARAASWIFWEVGADVAPMPGRAVPAPSGGPAGRIGLILAVMLVPLTMLAAAPISSFARAGADQLAARTPYAGAVLPADRPVEREVRP